MKGTEQENNGNSPDTAACDTMSKQVGTYHSASLLVSSKPPTPQVVSRGIALEGFCSMLAGLWGSGTGSTTLTENTHTINITKMASCRAVVFGALFLILFSFVGKDAIQAWLEKTS